MKKKKKHFLDNAKFGDWQMYQDNIRFRRVTYVDPEFGDVMNDYEMQTYGAPIWFGLFRQKKWASQITTNDLAMGVQWCKHILGTGKLPIPPGHKPI